MNSIEKDEFKARYGSGEHLENIIREANAEPLIRLAMRNPAFDQEHHQQMVKHRVAWVRHLTPYSPHVSADDLSHLMATERIFPGAMNAAMSHTKARTEDIKKIALAPEVHHQVKKGAVSYLHTRGALTPDLLRDIENAPNPPHIPMSTWNSVLPKDHEPLTSTDVHNHIVKHAGGTLK
jgi:hypothetical protein